MGRNFDGLGMSFEVDDGDSLDDISGIGKGVDVLWNKFGKAGDVIGGAGRAMGRGLGSLKNFAQRGVG